jgi:mono/diheme cytochrome c family protein
MRHKAIITIGVLAVAGIAYFKDDLRTLWDGFHVHVIDYPAPKQTRWLDQGVPQKDLRWFYHADQGTRTFMIPYDWFMALEQPTVPWLLFTRVAPFHETDYLDRFGFIPDKVIANDPAPLPIGFAKGTAMLDGNGAPFRNPHTKEDMKAIGLTCSACHTGRFTYKDTAVVIDGGPALTNLFELQKGIGLSLVLTRYWPGRFARFAEAIFGSDSTLEERMTLRDQLDLVLKQYDKIKDLEAKVEATSVDEGYGRLDALNRIGNQVFSLDLNNPANYAAHSAPVHFPRIWNAPWFDWVQYNGSIMQPMIRNAGESLGVSSDLNLIDPAKGLFKSSAEIKTLYEMERMIAGDAPVDKFTGITSPKWPKNILPPYDLPLAKQGAALYKQHCSGCHLPAIESEALAEEDKGEFFKNRKWWTKNDADQPILIVNRIPIEHVGTDGAQAEDMAARTVALPANLGIDNNLFGFALGDVVERVVKYWYNTQKTPQADRDRMNGYRPNKIDAPHKYKARPLNGVWATPPYLHNGSVPTIYALLSPVKDRPSTFYLGSREYDPKDLGYLWKEKISNGSLFDTNVRGNSNKGHEFSNDKPEGVIGPELKEEERRALIEFIKTM